MDPRAWTATGVRTIARRPRLSLAALLLLIICVWATAIARGTRPFDNGLRIWFLEGSPELRRLDEFHAAFGNDEVLVVAWREEGRVTEPAGLALVADVSSRLAALRGVEIVTSLATVLWTGNEVVHVKDGEDFLEVRTERLFPPRPTEDDAARARDRLERMPLLKELLLSPDGKTTLVQVAPGRTEDLDALRAPLLAAVKAETDAAFRAAGREPTWLWGGGGVTNEALNQASQHDSGVFTLASLVVIVVCLRLLLGSGRAVLLSASSVASAAVALVGVHFAAGQSLNMVTMVLPSLVLVVGLTDSVYFLSTWMQERAALEAKGLSHEECVAQVIGHAALPGLFNSVTSAVGFLSFLATDMAVLRVFGLFAGVGIALAYLCSVVVCTAGLVLLDVRGAPVEGTRADALFLRLARLVARRKALVLGGAGLVLAVGAAGVARLEFDSDPMRYFFEDHPVRAADATIERWFGPYLPLELVVDAGRADGVKEPALLRALDELGRRTETREAAVSKVSSVADVVRHIHRVLAEEEGLPGSLELVEQELVFGYDPDRSDDPIKLVDWPPVLLPRTAAEVAAGAPARVTPGWGLARVTMRCGSVGLKEGRAIIDRTLAEARGGLLPPGATIEPAGYAPLYASLIDYLVWGQVWSICTTFGVIGVVLLLLFRSWRWALLSLPANVIPVVATLGFMGWAGIPLDGATVLIASISLGVAVDDTIHLIFKLRELAAETGDEAVAVEQTLRTTGAAITTSSIVMALGFGVVGLASLKSVAWFGVLTAVTMVSALVAELLITPAVVLLTSPRRPSPT